MANDEILAGLDIGTHSIKCVVGVADKQGSIDVIGTGSAATRGIRAGEVQNRSDFVAAIRRAKEEAELMAGVELNDVVVSVSGVPLECDNSFGAWRVNGPVVEQADIDGVLSIARARQVAPNTDVLFCVPGHFMLDRHVDIAAPVGMKGVRLEVDVHLNIGVRETFDEISRCCREAGLNVRTFLPPYLASSESLLRSEDREMGIALVELGGSTTEVSVYAAGALVFTASLPVGGERVTSDLSISFQIPIVEAERLKQQSGSALAWKVGEHEQVELPMPGGKKARTVPRVEVAQVCENRYEEILQMVLELFQRHRVGTDGRLPNVVFTGGASQMPHLVDLAERVLVTHCVFGEPRAVRGMVDMVRNPKYAAATGIALHTARRKADVFTRVAPTAQTRTFLSRLMDWIR
jgi:cell division protein FtsA